MLLARNPLPTMFLPQLEYGIPLFFYCLHVSQDHAIVKVVFTSFPTC